MNLPRIKRDPKVMLGKPVIADTRITVEHILRHLGAGDTVEQLLANYPQLTGEDIRAAQTYAAECATDVPLNQTPFVLDKPDWAAFMHTLDNSPAPNPALKELLARKAPWER